MKTRSALLLAAALAHFALLIAVSSAETYVLIKSGRTAAKPLQKSASAPDDPFAAFRRGPLFLKRGVKTYLHLAGSESGYGFFAPNIPDGYRLTFELHNEGGLIESGALSPRRGEAGLRMASFLDYLGRTTSAPIREILLRHIADSFLERRPEVKIVRFTVESIRMPTLEEFKRGGQPSFDPVYSYDFTRGDADESPPLP